MKNILHGLTLVAGTWRKLGMPIVALTRATYFFRVKWGKPSSSSAPYKSFHAGTPVAHAH